MPNRHARLANSPNHIAADNGLLTAELRRRLADAVPDARRRAARDIQAGVLQHLAAMRMLTSSFLESAPEPDATISDIGAAIDAAMAELRDTVSTAEPASIASDGLGGALRASSAGSPLKVRINDELRRRHPMRAEQAVFFACRESIQNSIKHAGDGATLTVRLSDVRAGIEFSASDDGQGFDSSVVHHGVGLLNIKERVEGAGGTVAISSEAGRGVTVRGFVPDALAPSVAPPGKSLDHATLRRQILAETDAERLRIVRDLHDGAQQRLVALRVKITLATDRVMTGSALHSTLARIGVDADLAIAELRDLARSLRAPSDATAVAPALRRATQHWPMEVRVRERNLARQDAAVEQAVYGCVLEALHEARAQRGELPGAHAVVSLYQAADAIHFVIRDRSQTARSALVDPDSAGHMLDRAALVGGSISIQALPRSSVVRGVIPIGSVAA